MSRRFSNATDEIRSDPRDAKPASWSRYASASGLNRRSRKPSRTRLVSKSNFSGATVGARAVPKNAISITRPQAEPMTNDMPE